MRRHDLGQFPGNLKSGSNTLHFEIAEGICSVTIKEPTLTPAK